MTTPEAAELWGISVRQVHKYIVLGRVPAERRFVHRTWYWWIPDGTPKPERLPWSGGRPKKLEK